MNTIPLVDILSKQLNKVVVMKDTDYVLLDTKEVVPQIDIDIAIIEQNRLMNIELYQEWKTQRNNAVANIDVTYSGVIYQGDEDSQSRLSRAILALPDDVTTTAWVAKDNSVHQLTRIDLSAILALGGAEQSRLWNLGRP